MVPPVKAKKRKRNNCWTEHENLHCDFDDLLSGNFKKKKMSVPEAEDRLDPNEFDTIGEKFGREITFSIDSSRIEAKILMEFDNQALKKPMGVCLAEDGFRFGCLKKFLMFQNHVQSANFLKHN